MQSETTTTSIVEDLAAAAALVNEIEELGIAVERVHVWTSSYANTIGLRTRDDVDKVARAYSLEEPRLRAGGTYDRTGDIGGRRYRVTTNQPVCSCGTACDHGTQS